MMATINAAAEKNGYTLTDRGTWIKFEAVQKDKNPLSILVEGDKSLLNQYSVMTVNPAKCPKVKAELAKKFSDWWVSASTQGHIAAFQLEGKQLFFPNAAPAPAGVRLSSTIGPIDAGIVPLLAKKFEEKAGVKVAFEGAGTGATLKKAQTGEFDMVMVHARKLEDAFVAEGYGVDRRDVMYNDFVVLGPRNDPAKIKGLTSAAEAFKKIAVAKTLFVTRGDQSGTHVKELEVWEKAGIKPEGRWYLLFADGKLGNKATTKFADEKKAYTLMDRATYLTVKKEIALAPLVEGDAVLLNYIAVIAVNPAKFPNVNADGTKAFMDWLVDSEAQGIIKAFGVDAYGEPLFFPNAKK
jgi:tungstate transport system substrate-binding protein